MSSAGGSNRLFASDLTPLKKASNVLIFPDADNPGFKYATLLTWYCRAQDIPCQVLDTNALGWSHGEDAADHPEFTLSDYEPHLLIGEDWLEKYAEDSDNALFEVISHLSQADFDRALDRLNKLTGLSKPTLKQERKNRFKTVAVEAETVTDDVADIDLPRAQKEVRRNELYPIVANIAETSNILDLVVSVCQNMLDVHGESSLIKLAYLSIVSRLFDAPGERPVSLILKGSSGSGKSHVIKQVLQLFRPEATWILLSSASPKALIYDPRSYRGKVIFMPECNQLVEQDNLMTQLVKTVLTEGRITHLTVDTEGSSPEGRVITKEGPISLIVGTIRDYMDSELETRVLSIYVDESSDQTRHIVLKAAERLADASTQDREAITTQLIPWQAFDEWVALSPTRKVIIPFYQAVVTPIQHMPIRFRRDLVEMVPALIKALALIHQSKRKVVDGVIHATIDDYEEVRPMVNEFLFRMQTDGNTPSQNKLLKLIYDQMPETVRQGHGSLKINQSEISLALGIKQQSVAYHMNKLIENGYLVNKQLVPKRPAMLSLGPAFNLATINTENCILQSASALGLM